MDGRALSIALVVLLLVGGDPAGAREPYRLLSLGGHLVKWGPAELGTSATATYGFVGTVRHFPDARNCRGMRPLRVLLATSGISQKQLTRETHAAFDRWSDVAGIRFRPARPGEQPDILIGAQLKQRGRAFANVDLGAKPAPGRPAVDVAAGRALKKRGQRMAWPHAGGGKHAAPGVKAIKQAMICLNSDWRWKIGYDGNLQSYDLRHTLTHEIGHTIGLDHAGARGQIMSFRYQEDLPGLQGGDVAGAVRLYGPPR